jgi:hypothetical protein
MWENSFNKNTNNLPIINDNNFIKEEVNIESKKEEQLKAQVSLQ